MDAGRQTCGAVYWEAGLLENHFLDGSSMGDRDLHLLRNTIPNWHEQMLLRNDYWVWFQHDGTPTHKALNIN